MEKVLIIDDNPTDRIVQTKMLEPQYDVRSAKDPYEGSDIIREWQPDIVVIDYAMPRMNGIQAIKFFKEKVKYDGIYLILTGLDDINVATEAIRQGAYDYLVKPLVSEMFNHKIKNCINYKKLLKSEKEKIAIASVERIILLMYYEFKPLYEELSKLLNEIIDTKGEEKNYTPLKECLNKLGHNINKFRELDDDTKKDYVDSILEHYVEG